MSVLPIFANGAVTAAFSAVVSEGVGAISEETGVEGKSKYANDDPRGFKRGAERELFGGKILVSKAGKGAVVTDSELLQVEWSFNEVFADQDGSKIYFDLSEKEPLRVVLNEKKKFSAPVSKFMNKQTKQIIRTEGKMILTVDIRPGKAGRIKNYHTNATSSKFIISLERALLHETGHAVYGYLDDNDQNVKFVDGIMGRLNNTERRYYSND